MFGVLAGFWGDFGILCLGCKDLACFFFGGFRYLVFRYLGFGLIFVWDCALLFLGFFKLLAPLF